MNVTKDLFDFDCHIILFEKGGVQINNNECLNGWWMQTTENKIEIGGMGWECKLGGVFETLEAAVDYINKHKDIRMTPWPG